MVKREWFNTVFSHPPTTMYGLLRHSLRSCVIGLLLAGCQAWPAREQPLAMTAGWQPMQFSAEGVHTVGWQKPRPATLSSQVWQVYIEGDGFAWAAPDRPANDPTPKQPVAMQLALLDPAPAVVYLARPCQFAARQFADCAQSRWWTAERFSRPVVNHYHALLNQLAAQGAGPSFALIGYSGGAAIAVMLAAERQDVVSVRTVAGNLDPAWINQYHRVSAMPASLNPLAFAGRLRRPQLHMVSDADCVVPPMVATRFVQALPEPRCAHIIQGKAQSHQQGWATDWPRLLAVPLPDCPAASP